MNRKNIKKINFLKLSKKNFLRFFIFLMFFNISVSNSEANNDPYNEVPPEYENATVLPATQIPLSDCKAIMNYTAMNKKDIIEKLFLSSDREAYVTNNMSNVSGPESNLLYANDILGCGIKTGRIKMWMVPYYIRYILEFIINIGWLVVIGGLIYGGYLYMFGPLTESKDQGKTAILYSIGGMVLILTAWAIVNIVLSIVSI